MTGMVATPGPAVVFHSRRRFWLKSAFLAAATIALIPILLMQHELAAVLYVVFLTVVHLVGLVVFALGVKRHDIAPTRRGLWNRVAGLAVAIALLYLASQGLKTEVGTWIFWGSLFAIWLIHTLALTMLHLRGRAEQQACPFV